MMKQSYILSLLFLFCTVVTGQVTLVGDLNPGVANFSPSNITVYNGNMFFAADDSSGTNTGGVDLGRELWISDGTLAGTSLLKDINPNNFSSAPFNFFVFNNILYFTANDGSSELWKTDGTSAGTVKEDIIPSAVGEAPNRATSYINQVFMTALLNGVANQLIEWDGVNPAVKAADATNPNADARVFEMTEFKNELYMYMSYSPDDATTGNELYSYDPATDIFTLIADVDSGPGNSGISNFIPTLNTLYFEALGNLYQSDGTAAGTIEVPAAATLSLNGVSNLYRFNDLILFEADAGAGDQLYTFNTVSGLINQLSFNSGNNINHDPSDYEILNGLVYYRGEDSNDTDGNLYSTDGVTITQIDNTIKDIDDITVFNNKLYFEGEQDGVTGNELFTYDPATASITQLTGLGSIGIYPNPAGQFLQLSGDLNDVESYQIYDMAGRQVMESSLKSNKISLDLAAGTYILQIHSENNSISLKFVKE
ncbi:T9SS type A sorting domain-containing protein [Nonlabens xiamenensis]|uniref:T9SS type A sorting domain-containing protein n=1 Tax=Nonlabens xiamenensis TaxID=2341043 RepID=UPI000F61129B|nr:T9SS type A sorting domain-containing protein [Nonlabens xiamenensis]